MSTSPESGSPEMGLDLDLHFLPAWAQKPTENQYAKYEGREERFDRGRGDRPQRRPGGGGGGGRPQGRPSGPGGPGQGPRPGGDRGPNRDGGRPQFQDRGRRPEQRSEPPPPPLEIDVSFIPEEKGVESLARQIRLTGRAYPLFDVAFLILKKADRYTVRFEVIKKPDGTVMQPLFVCALDDTLWLSEQDAVDYVLGKHFGTFYQAERTPTDPPKGTYTFVAQCGLSGAILGPPNYHDYQNKLRKLHTERFARMPFEAFKARIKIVRDEAVVKKWLDDQSWKTEFICLNVPETLKLGTRAEVEQHFRQTHMANVMKSVEGHTLSGTAAQALPTAALQRLVRRCWDDQMRFPLRMVNVLSQQFAGHGLQFFKVNKTVTHVAVARPRYLDLEATPVSEGVQRIVDFIQAHPNCTRRKLFEALVPTPAPVVPVVPAAPPVPGAPVVEPPPTPEMAAVISDLHWLVHQGHVIEFAKGNLELAKKPLPRPEPRPPKPEAAAAVPGAAVTPVPGAEAPATTPETAAAQPAAEVEGVVGVESAAPSAAPASEAAAAVPAPAPAAPAPELAVAPAQPTPAEQPNAPVVAAESEAGLVAKTEPA